MNEFEGSSTLKKSFISEKLFTLDLAFSSALNLPTISSAIKYLEDDLQYIFQIILEAKILATLLSIIYLYKLC